VTISQEMPLVKEQLCPYCDFGCHLVPIWLLFLLCHFMSHHAISSVIGLFRPAFNKVGRSGAGGGVKFVFLGLWRQLRWQAEGKNAFNLPKINFL
jgi:hypothetical protein